MNIMKNVLFLNRELKRNSSSDAPQKNEIFDNLKSKKLCEIISEFNCKWFYKPTSYKNFPFNFRLVQVIFQFKEDKRNTSIFE